MIQQRVNYEVVISQDYIHFGSLTQQAATVHIYFSFVYTLLYTYLFVINKHVSQCSSSNDRIEIYLTKIYITQTMFCIASCRPSLIPHIITTLDHAHTTNHCPID